MELARARVADAERSDVLDRLNEQHACGRLDIEELDVRVSAALDAQTLGELHRLVADLPPRNTVAPVRSRAGSRIEDWLTRQAVPTLLPASCMAAGGLATTIVTQSGSMGLISVIAGYCGLMLGRVTARRR